MRRNTPSATGAGLSYAAQRARTLAIGAGGLLVLSTVEVWSTRAGDWHPYALLALAAAAGLALAAQGRWLVGGVACVAAVTILAHRNVFYVAHSPIKGGEWLGLAALLAAATLPWPWVAGLGTGSVSSMLAESWWRSAQQATPSARFLVFAALTTGIAAAIAGQRDAWANGQREASERLEREQGRLRRQQACFVALGETLRSVPPRDAWTRIATELTAAVAATGAGVWRLDEEGTTARATTLFSATSGVLPADALRTVAEWESLAGCVRSGNIVEIQSPAQGPAFDPSADPRGSSTLVAPTTLFGRPAGLLTVTRAAQQGWHPDEHLFLGACASHVSRALEAEARLEAERRLTLQNEYLEALSSIAPELLAAGSLEDRLRRIVDAALRILRTDSAALCLLNEEGTELRPGVLAGMVSGWGAAIPADRGVVGRVLRSGRAEAIANYGEWDDRQTQLDHLAIGAAAAVPLRGVDGPIGVLGVGFHRPDRAFGPDELAILTRFSDLASVALSLHELHSNLRQELLDRRRAELTVRRLNAELESRVRERTQDLEAVTVAQASLQGALRRAAAEWQATFDSVESPMLLVGDAAILRRCNQAALAALGARDFGEVIGRRVADLASGGPWQAAAAAAEEAFAKSRVEPRQVRSAGDARTWDVSANLLSAISPPLAIVQVRDVSRIVDLQESLRRASTLSAVGTLVVGVAHEVRNPLFAITANLDCLEQEYGEQDPALFDYVLHLRRETSRMERLLRGLLEYATPKLRVRAAGAVLPLVREAVARCQALVATKQLTVEVRGAEGLPEVQMDAERLAQVFQNLIENAVHFSPPAAHISVDAALCSDGTVEVAFSDEGPGLPPGPEQQIFEPFFSTRRGGTGLGLAISYRIVEEHDGTMIAGNRAGGGARVAVRLPAAGTPRADARSSA